MAGYLYRVCVTLIFCFLVFTATARADVEYIDITDPSLKKIPLAIPLFKNISGQPEHAPVAIQAADFVAATLDFTGYFKMLDRGSFLADPASPNIVASTITFQNWTAIGAELLITGGYMVTGDFIEMELRLFDPFKSRLLVGKRYKGALDDQRKIIRRFCSEVIYRLTGNRGIFDSEIAFVSNGSGHKEIYISEFDGHNPKQFTRTRNITLSPAWSSDGNWIAYTGYKGNQPRLYIKHRREQRGAVFAQDGVKIDPAWVPGRFELGATLSFEGDPEIYLLTGKGKIIKKLTRSRGIDLSPSWSPDGRKIAFVSRRHGSPQIYIKDLKSGNVRRLTYRGRYNQQPSWSPAGDRIAYVSMVNGRLNIFAIDLNGNTPVQLTHGAGDNESPSWSPDGSLIAFSSTREGPSRIYVMSAHGGDQRRLLTLNGEQSNPSWSPRQSGD